MKDISLISLTQAANTLTLSEDCFNRYCQYHGISIKPDETQVLRKFVDKLNDNDFNECIFNHFFVGYCIPQISKEFDLLRIGENYIVNIELKRESTEEKIKTQLIQNHYYLKFLNEKIFNFTYELSTDSLYFLKDDNLNVVNFNFLRGILLGQILIEIKNIDSLFNPSNYLVSPFNSTDKFLAGQYFLTSHQDNIKNKVIKRVNTAIMGSFTAINGKAGTGKTLLTYDIANNLTNAGKKVLLIHCGYLNEGHGTLIQHGWCIQEVSKLDLVNTDDYDVIFIDEVQRIWLSQFNDFVEKIKKSMCKCIFSYDESQTLSNKEARFNIPEKIASLSGVVVHTLSEKIRTNKEVASFIRGFFNNTKNERFLNRGNVSFEFYSTMSAIKLAMCYLKNKGWNVLQLTPNKYGVAAHEKYLDITCKKSHYVIGQEFDKVVVIVDSHFNYNTSGQLTYLGRSFYPAEKMLFQNMTRTRNQLKILILNNPVILDRCLTLLTPPQSQQTN